MFKHILPPSSPLPPWEKLPSNWCEWILQPLTVCRLTSKQMSQMVDTFDMWPDYDPINVSAPVYKEGNVQFFASLVGMQATFGGEHHHMNNHRFPLPTFSKVFCAKNLGVHGKHLLFLAEGRPHTQKNEKRGSLQWGGSHPGSRSSGSFRVARGRPGPRAAAQDGPAKTLEKLQREAKKRWKAEEGAGASGEATGRGPDVLFEQGETSSDPT